MQLFQGHEVDIVTLSYPARLVLAFRFILMALSQSRGLYGTTRLMAVSRRLYPVDRLAGNADIVVDCLDNYDARFVLNTYCLRHRFLVGGQAAARGRGRDEL